MCDVHVESVCVWMYNLHVVCGCLCVYACVCVVCVCVVCSVCVCSVQYMCVSVVCVYVCMHACSGVD